MHYQFNNFFPIDNTQVLSISRLMAEKMRREMMQGEEEEYEELMKNEAGKRERTYLYNKVERAEFRQKDGKIVYYVDFPETWHTAAEIYKTIPKRVLKASEANSGISACHTVKIRK